MARPNEITDLAAAAGLALESAYGDWDRRDVIDLEIIAAKPAGHIHRFADEVEP